MMSKISIVMPDQEGHGTHINVSGGALARYAPHREPPRASWSIWPATRRSATWPMATTNGPRCHSVAVRNTALESLGKFKQDTLPISNIGRAQVNAARIIDRAGWR
jgi:iron(III) transport system substrate-binding protein